MTDKQPTTRTGENVRFVGAFIITFVVSGIAVMDQLRSGEVDDMIVGALLLIFLSWLGENIVDLVMNVFGRR